MTILNIALLTSTVVLGIYSYIVTKMFKEADKAFLEYVVEQNDIK